ncbi:hypothetical protein GCM10025867_02260 [Frondihabitans sucicola]|uniref:Uncharacterized protein n=1 Tax=Frondihabitans sucicola TaxID=1268041 RepID=A0ABM8GHZ4_9MICO|nr:hypothetical protein GCM10025867_02260 [Frondihabitans sucicola]
MAAAGGEEPIGHGLSIGSAFSDGVAKLQARLQATRSGRRHRVLAANGPTSQSPVPSRGGLAYQKLAPPNTSKTIRPPKGLAPKNRACGAFVVSIRERSLYASAIGRNRPENKRKPPMRTEDFLLGSIYVIK